MSLSDLRDSLMPEPATPIERLTTYIASHDATWRIDGQILHLTIDTEDAHMHILNRTRVAADIMKVRLDVHYDGAPNVGPFSKDPYPITLHIHHVPTP